MFMRFGETLVLVLSGWFGFGCQLPPASPPAAGPSLAGLKIGDLAPVDSSLDQVRCAFAVLVWRVPQEKLGEIPQVLSMLSSKTILFSDASGFESNGMWAAAGSYSQVPVVLRSLAEIGCRRLGTKKLLIFQDYPEEITGFSVDSGQTLFYFGPEKIPAGKQVPAGRLSLMLRARPDSPQRGFTSVRIEPVFQPAAGGYGMAASFFEPFSFREGRLLMRMTEGDFVVLAAPKPEMMSVFSRFFMAPSEKEPGLLLYLVVCQKAGE